MIVFRRKLLFTVAIINMIAADSLNDQLVLLLALIYGDLGIELHSHGRHLQQADRHHSWFRFY